MADKQSNDARLAVRPYATQAKGEKREKESRKLTRRFPKEIP